MTRELVLTIDNVLSIAGNGASGYSTVVSSLGGWPEIESDRDRVRDREKESADHNE